MILDRDYYYIVNNNKIVIRRKEQEYITVQGDFFDNTDQKPIEYVTLYEPTLKLGTMSNEQGHFSLKVPVNSAVTLLVNRVSYYDTNFTISGKSNTNIKIGLTPNITTEQAVTIRSVEKHWLARSVISTKQKFSSLNLKNYFYQRKFQLGFWPGIGTKNALKGQQENKISFNVFGGYAAQVDALEIGGLFNIVKKHVRSVQVGGLFNVVGGTMDGVQVAGLYNDVGGNVSGLQIGGLVNINKSNTKGLQIGGIYNQDRIFNGLQIAGIMNNSKIVSKGAQIAGLVNRAQKINGFQLGFINIADTMNGVSIGPFNYSRNGKHSLSVSTQENGQLSMSYKSGGYRLYNILQVGTLNTDIGQHYFFGYGLGSEWFLKRKLKMAAELSNLYFTSAKEFDTDYSTISLQPLLVYQLHKKVQLFAGPRLQYQLPVHNHSNDYYKSLNKNMIPLKEGSKDALHLGFSVGVNIF
nr:carboxypeptidase-like regulatory domain-containing protein [Niabella ginsengisoli]